MDENAVILGRSVRQEVRPDNLPAVLRTFAGIRVFCILSGVVTSSTISWMSKSDRQHPTKRNRPIASGKLPCPRRADRGRASW